MADPVAYALLATQSDPIKTGLTTTVTSRGQTRQQITHINLAAHSRSVIGRTYWQILTNPYLTQLDSSTPLLRYNQTRGLMGRPIDSMTWTKTILSRPDILTIYEAGLHESEEKQQQPQDEHHPPPNTPKVPKHPSIGKKEMPPQDRQIPNPLKLLPPNQVVEAKVLAAQQRQQAGIRREQEKIRAAEAAEKATTQNASKHHC